VGSLDVGLSHVMRSGVLIGVEQVRGPSGT